jgi:threonyl-tRNA synthetase
MPVSESHTADAAKMMAEICSAGVRVSLDDTDATVGKKVRRAKQDWCSYAAVIGDEEAKSGRMKVFVRSENKDIEMTVDELVERIKKESEGKPFRPLYLPAELSKRCDF